MDGEDLAKIAIEKQAELSNEQLAIRQANQVEGLEVSDEGEIESFEGEKVEVMEELVEKYKEMMGDVAANLIAQEMKKNDVKVSEIPEELQNRL